MLKIDDVDELNPAEIWLPVAVGSTVDVPLFPVGYGGMDEATDVLIPPEMPEPTGPTEIPVPYGYVRYTGAVPDAASPLDTYVEFRGYFGFNDGRPVDKITLLEYPDDRGAVPAAIDVANAVEFV